jgi:hypothetical protein
MNLLLARGKRRRSALVEADVERSTWRTWRSGNGAMQMKRIVMLMVLAAGCLAAGPAIAAEALGQDPLTVEGLICLWDFQEEADQDRIARGPHRYALQERQGPIRRVEGGVLGPLCARIERGQWLVIPRSDCPALNIHGQGAQYTILAWVQRRSDTYWHFIAGMWNETDAMRQYAMFYSGGAKTDWRTFTRTPARYQPHAYISVEGGASPGKPFCFSYATGSTVLQRDRWYFLAATYDQKALRMYVDGRLDELENCNPFEFAGKPIFDGAAGGADFTVGHRKIPSWSDYPQGRPPQEGFDGLISGLAVYNRALSADEIAAIHRYASEKMKRRE